MIDFSRIFFSSLCTPTDARTFLEGMSATKDMKYVLLLGSMKVKFE